MTPESGTEASWDGRTHFLTEAAGPGEAWKLPKAAEGVQRGLCSLYTGSCRQLWTARPVGPAVWGGCGPRVTPGPAGPWIAIPPATAGGRLPVPLLFFPHLQTPTPWAGTKCQESAAGT